MNEAEQRFWDRADRGAPHDCWLWLGSINTGGYGRVHFAGENTYAHRVAYTLRYGAIPTGLQIDHLCRARSCVNPAHLEAVTQAENLRRGISPFAINWRAGKCKHGHEFTPDNTYIRRDNGRRQCIACSRQRKRERRARGLR
jgi:hypothetical protein